MSHWTTKYFLFTWSFEREAPRDLSDRGWPCIPYVLDVKQKSLYLLCNSVYPLSLCEILILVSFQISEAVIVSVFAHVCHVMTFIPADCMDQLFVLTLDLVTRPTVSNSNIREQLKSSVNILSSEVHRTALTQKLNQNLQTIAGIV